MQFLYTTPLHIFACSSKFWGRKQNHYWTLIRARILTQDSWTHHLLTHPILEAFRSMWMRYPFWLCTTPTCSIRFPCAWVPKVAPLWGLKIKKKFWIMCHDNPTQKPALKTSNKRDFTYFINDRLVNVVNKITPWERIVMTVIPWAFSFSDFPWIWVSDTISRTC